MIPKELIPYVAFAVAVAFFWNKLLLLEDSDKKGWVVGAVTAPVCTWYFFSVGTYVFTVFEVGITAIMVYGALKGEQKRPRVELALAIATLVTMSVLTFFVMTGLLTVLEFVGSVIGLAGMYCMAHDQRKYGWPLCAVSHICTAVVMHDKHQDFFAAFQVASAMVSYVGYEKCKIK